MNWFTSSAKYTEFLFKSLFLFHYIGFFYVFRIVASVARPRQLRVRLRRKMPRRGTIIFGFFNNCGLIGCLTVIKQACVGIFVFH
jgi:hypothetical protein